MLANLVEIQERVLEALDERGHATKRGSLELLALEKRLAILEQTDVISRNSLNQVLRSGKLAQGDTEMVGIVERVEQVLVERMNVLQSGKAFEDGAELFAKRLLRKLDFSCIERYRFVSQSFISKNPSTAEKKVPPRILPILKPTRICVGSLRCVRLRAISRNS